MRLPQVALGLRHSHAQRSPASFPAAASCAALHDTLLLPLSSKFALLEAALPVYTRSVAGHEHGTQPRLRSQAMTHISMHGSTRLVTSKPATTFVETQLRRQHADIHLDTPWIVHMSTSSKSSNDASSPQPAGDPQNPTYASFSPANLGQTTPQTKLRSAILVHQKSPLLAATPPQITRVLAYSHPFILPLNKFAGLVTWTTGDPWESFLLVATFWAVVLYGDAVTRYAGPIIVVSGLILGMYTRRYSPLSSTGWTGEKGQKAHKRVESDTNIKHHKSLEEIVDSLKLFTSRCNILLDPFLRLTDFLSTQRTATSATTRPALTVLFIRILFVLPLWIALTLPPFYILTTKRVVLAVGTVMLSWHSRPARVTRTLLWRSRTVRRTCAFITGLDFGEIVSVDRKGAPPLPPRKKSTQEVAASLAAKRRPESTGVRFTFSIYENQRRWLGIGWTSSMLAYERASWTDEHLNPVPPKEHFELPEVEGGQSRWRWVQGSEWKVEGAEKDSKAEKGVSKEDSAWIYYDNKVRLGNCPRIVLILTGIVERWTKRPRRLGTLHSASEMVSRRRARRIHLFHRYHSYAHS